MSHSHIHTAPQIVTPSRAAFAPEQMIRLTLDTFCRGVVEIRALGVGGKKNHTHSGYFDDYQKAVQAVLPYVNDQCTLGVYFVINRIRDELLSRAANRMKPFADVTTSDTDVMHRRWLYVDCDSIRASGISATDQEIKATLEKAEAVKSWLMQRALPEPITAASGNGAHLGTARSSPPFSAG